MITEQFKTEIQDVTVYGNPLEINKDKIKEYSDVMLIWEMIFELKPDCLKAVHIQCKGVKLICETHYPGSNDINCHALKTDFLDWTEKHMNAPFVDGQIKPQAIVIDYRTKSIELTF